MPIPGDVAGNPLATAPGSGNASYALPMQGVPGGVAMPISGTVAATQSGTWNITNISGTISLPTGAATAALQTTGNTTLSTINTTLGSPFQAGGNIGNTSFAVTNVGTFAVQATLQASATTAIGKVDPNTIATWGLATVGAGSAPTNMEVGGLSTIPVA